MSTMGSGVQRAGRLTADWPGASSEGPEINRTDRIRRENTLADQSIPLHDGFLECK